MTPFDPRLIVLVLPLLAAMTFTSCTIDENAAFLTSNSATGDAKKSKTTKVKTDSQSWAEKMEVVREEREKERAAAAKAKEKELAQKKKEDAAKERKLAYEKKKEDAAKKALAEKKAKAKAAEDADRKALAEKKAKAKAAEDAAKRKAREESIAKAKKEREANRRSTEVAAVSNRSGGGGFFSSLSISTPSKYKSKGHHVKVNGRLLNSLSPSNAKIEIDLSDQRARVYQVGGGTKQLVIETQISTGKSGHTTPTGTYRISEKLVQKRSTRYGRWVNSSGATIRSSGDSHHRPSGASAFVGAEMPYWMRVNGGIGMHIGYVPNGPASHGCIRVPSAVQPLIFSKVGVGTQVSITL